MGSITQIINAGADAFSNIFDVIISFPKNVISTEEDTADLQSSLSVRAKGFNFQTPDVDIQANIHYKSVTLHSYTTKFSGIRLFTLTFRCDASFDILNKFYEWKHYYSDPTGEGHLKYGSIVDTAADDFSFGSVNVSVPDLTAGDNRLYSPLSAMASMPPPARWLFEGVSVHKIVGPNFTRDSSSPAEFTVHFLYKRIEEPGGDIFLSGLTPAGVEAAARRAERAQRAAKAKAEADAAAAKEKARADAAAAKAAADAAAARSSKAGKAAALAAAADARLRFEPNPEEAYKMFGRPSPDEVRLSQGWKKDRLGAVVIPPTFKGSLEDWEKEFQAQLRAPSPDQAAWAAAGISGRVHTIAPTMTPTGPSLRGR